MSVKQGGAGDPIGAKQSVLIGYQNSSAMAQHQMALETNNEDECNIFALGSGGYGKQGEAIESMLKSFRSNEKITLGFTAKSQHSGHDKFAKLETTLVAIGSKWSRAQTSQFCGRVGRIGAKIEDSDLVPEAYTAVHFDCEWTKLFATFDDARGTRSVVLSDEVKDAMDTLPKSNRDVINVNCKKLVRAGQCTVAQYW